MDLHTIKQKIKNGKCTSLGDFVQDVHLIFSNCLLYHKRHSQIGKASVTLRTYFENRCSDLGFDDLGLIEGEKNTNSGQGKLGRRSARQKWTLNYSLNCFILFHLHYTHYKLIIVSYNNCWILFMLWNKIVILLFDVLRLLVYCYNADGCGYIIY